ncbi:MAG TPA: hypothetical protein VGI40_10950, partial [Pirellulaceae bacterium]
MATRRDRKRRQQHRACRTRRLILEQYEPRMLLTGIAPVGQDVVVTTLEDTAYLFQRSDFHFSDPNDTPQDDFAAVEITTLPLAGSLTDDGKAISAGQFISVADIDSGKLQFVPAANGNGIAYASFTFQVQDTGETFNGGVNLDPTPNTATINVIWISHAPVGQNHTVTALEDTSFVFQTSDFPFTDPGETAVGLPPNNLAAVKIVSTPALGSLTLFTAIGDVPVTPGQFIQASDITAGKLRFLGNANASATPYTAFTFEIQDNGDTAGGGSNLDLTSHTQTITVLPVNDAPSGFDNAITTLSCPSSSTYTFSRFDFGFWDPNDSPPNAMTAVIIVSPPTISGLMYRGASVSAGQVVTVTDLNAGLLTFTGPVGRNPPTTTFTFEVKDDGGTANGGVDTDPIPRTLTINRVPGPSRQPTGGDTSINAVEDVPYHLGSSSFPNDFSDTNLLAVKIVSLPSVGVITDNGAAVVPGQIIPVADLASGLLVYMPLANAANPAGLTSFVYSYRDDGGVCWNPTEFQFQHTAFINVMPVNDPPIGLDNIVTINEDSQYTFSAFDFPMTDPSDLPQNSLRAVRIDTLPSSGTLMLNGQPVQVGQMIDKFDLNGLVFTPGADRNDGNSSRPLFT